MFRIIGQPINMRHVGNIDLAIAKENKDWQLITRVAKFGLKHGYNATVDAFNISKSTY